jgi:hypothetical protein
VAAPRTSRANPYYARGFEGSDFLLQKFILVGFTPGEKLRLKPGDLRKGLVGPSDIAVEISAAWEKNGKVSIVLERIGTPRIAGCRNSCPSGRSPLGNLSIELSGFSRKFTPTDLLPLWDNLLVTPERYLELRNERVGQGESSDRHRRFSQ